jgi:hypothetical protein
MNQLDELLAKQQITEQLYTYCRAFDRMDRDLALSVWHAGGTVQYGAGPLQPVEVYLGPSWDFRWTLNNSSHQVTNILIEISGDRAASEAYVTATLQHEPVDNRIVEHIYHGRYVDSWSRRRERWALDHRQFVADSYTRLEFAAGLAPPGMLEVARRDRQDPSYLAFHALAQG